MLNISVGRVGKPSEGRISGGGGESGEIRSAMRRIGGERFDIKRI